MRRMIPAIGLCLALCLASVGCGATKGQLNQLSVRVDSQVARIEALETKTAELEIALAEATASVEELTVRLDTRLDEIVAQANATATSLAELSPKVAAFRQQLTELTTATSGAQQTLIRNLETALLIYKQQYLAIEEALERLKNESREVLPER